MGWYDSDFDGCGCGRGGYSDDDRRSGRRNRDRCDGRDLIRGISKNDFIKVFLKSSHPVKGFFAGVSKNVLTLFDRNHRCISSIDICLEDIVAIKSFSNSFDDDCDDDHNHKDNHKRD